MPRSLAPFTGRRTKVHIKEFAWLRRLLEHPNLDITAVEPNDGMRAGLRQNLPTVKAVSGLATSIPVEDNSLDALFVAQVSTAEQELLTSRMSFEACSRQQAATLQWRYTHAGHNDNRLKMHQQL